MAIMKSLLKKQNFECELDKPDETEVSRRWRLRCWLLFHEIMCVVARVTDEYAVVTSSSLKLDAPGSSETQTPVHKPAHRQFWE